MRFVRFYVFKRMLNDVIKRFVKAVQFETVVSFCKKKKAFSLWGNFCRVCVIRGIFHVADDNVIIVCK